MTKTEKIYKLIEEFIENENSYWKIEWINSRAFAVFDEVKRITFGYGSKYDIVIKGLDPEERGEMFSIQKDLLERMYGYEEVVDDYDRDMNFIKNYKPDGYIIATDSNSVLDESWAIDSIETYAWDISEAELDYFWSAGGFEMMCEDINEIAKHTDCYTYKGKRWYVVPKYDDVYFEYAFYNENGELEWESFEGYGIYMVPEGESEKIIKIIADWKKSLEINSLPDFIWDEINESFLVESIEELGVDLDAIREISYKLTSDDEICNLPLSEIKELIKYEIVKREGDSFFIETTNVKKDIPGFEKMVRKLGMSLEKTFVPGAYIKIDAFIKYGEEYHISWLEFLLDVFDKQIASPEKPLKRIVLEKLREIHNKLYTRYLNKLKMEEILAKAEKVCVTFEDSLKGGNCKAGTIAFIERHKINTQKVECINGKELYEMAYSDEKRYVLNAIKAAIKRMEEEQNESN